jgi:hypothetical protein
VEYAKNTLFSPEIGLTWPYDKTLWPECEKLLKMAVLTLGIPKECGWIGAQGANSGVMLAESAIVIMCILKRRCQILLQNFSNIMKGRSTENTKPSD